jgi:hypothetical protein
MSLRSDSPNGRLEFQRHHANQSRRKRDFMYPGYSPEFAAYISEARCFTRMRPLVHQLHLRRGKHILCNKPRAPVGKQGASFSVYGASAGPGSPDVNLS